MDGGNPVNGNRLGELPDGVSTVVDSVALGMSALSPLSKPFFCIGIAFDD